MWPRWNYKFLNWLSHKMHTIQSVHSVSRFNVELHSRRIVTIAVLTFALHAPVALSASYLWHRRKHVKIIKIWNSAPVCCWTCMKGLEQVFHVSECLERRLLLHPNSTREPFFVADTYHCVVFIASFRTCSFFHSHIAHAPSGILCFETYLAPQKTVLAPYLGQIFVWPLTCKYGTCVTRHCMHSYLTSLIPLSEARASHGSRMHPLSHCLFHRFCARNWKCLSLNVWPKGFSVCFIQIFARLYALCQR